MIFVNRDSLSEDSLIDGGSGVDVLNFGFVYNLDGQNPSSTAVTVDMSSLGAARNIEGVVGSGFADQLTGDVGDNVLIGGGDSDLLVGSNGSDIIFGDYDSADSGGGKYGLRQYDIQNSQGNDILRGGEGRIGWMGMPGTTS